MPEASPILDAGRGLAALGRVHDELADRRDKLRPGDPCGPLLAAELDQTYRQIVLLEQTILATHPATPAEAVVVLMIAASEINIGNSFVDGDSIVEAGELAVRRATRLLGRVFDMDLDQFAGQRYLPAWLGPEAKA